MCQWENVAHYKVICGITSSHPHIIIILQYCPRKVLIFELTYEPNLGVILNE